MDCRLPLVQGCTFAALVPMILIGKQYGMRHFRRRKIVAMANKLARTVWAIAAHDRVYDKNHVSIRPY